MCGSDEWRQMIRDVILPWALDVTDPGDDVLEVGPGYGATTDVLCRAVPKLTSVEIDPKLAALLRERYADVSTVQIVNADATHAGLPRRNLHCDPARRWWPATASAAPNRPRTTTVTPTTRSTRDAADRLGAAGFVDVDVRTNPYGWAVAHAGSADSR